MARRVFFSFHFARDSWRVSQVRNSWLTKANSDASRFLDKAEWEAIERKGRQAIQNWIDSQMLGTSVTVVLIGAETASREWVEYEIKKTVKDGKGLLGVRIHNLKNQSQQTDYKGTNPFDQLYTVANGIRRPLTASYRTYDWVLDDGYNHIGAWIEAAARAAGR